jgi:hypothetical protein
MSERWYAGGVSIAAGRALLKKEGEFVVVDGKPLSRMKQVLALPTSPSLSSPCLPLLVKASNTQRVDGLVNSARTDTVRGQNLQETLRCETI